MIHDTRHTPGSRMDAPASSTQQPVLIARGTGPFEDFHPLAASPCFCGSHKVFANCCGSSASKRTPPYGIFIVENYLDAETTRSLANFARQGLGERLMVIDREASTVDNIVKVEDQRRVSERIDLGERRAEVNEIVGTAFRNLARKFLAEELDWYESPELMRYRPGGLYIKHADSQNMNPESRVWNKVIDRDLSLLIYLNDDYEGGSLRFDKLNYRLRPRAGMAVMFPSDNRYVHAAEEVTAGERFVIVSWASVHGVPKISSKPPEPALYYD